MYILCYAIKNILYASTPFTKERYREREKEREARVFLLVCVSRWNGIHSRAVDVTHPSTSTLSLYMKVDGMASTHSLCKGDRGRTRGRTVAHPSTHSPCMCKWMEWHPFPPFTKEREREREKEKEKEKESESKVMPFTHSLPLYTKADGMACTHSPYEGERECKGSGCHPSIHLHTPFVYESGWNGIHSFPLQKRERKNKRNDCHPPIHSTPLCA